MHAFFTDEWKAESLRLQKERDALKAELESAKEIHRSEQQELRDRLWQWRFGVLLAIAISVYAIVVHFTQGVCN